MNRKVVGVILILLAIAIVAFYAWPKISQFTAPPPADTSPTLAPGEVPVK